MTNYDISLLGNDLRIQNGDFIIGESDQQHIADTINAFPGWWKQFPADGVGVLRYLRSSGQQQKLCQEVKLQLQADGYQVNNPQAIFNPDGTLIVNPNATKP